MSNGLTHSHLFGELPVSSIFPESFGGLGQWFLNDLLHTLGLRGTRRLEQSHTISTLSPSIYATHHLNNAWSWAKWIIKLPKNDGFSVLDIPSATSGRCCHWWMVFQWNSLHGSGPGILCRSQGGRGREQRQQRLCDGWRQLTETLWVTWFGRVTWHGLAPQYTTFQHQSLIIMGKSPHMFGVIWYRGPRTCLDKMGKKLHC